MKIQPGKTVTIDYTLRLETGELVESTIGKTPFEFIYEEDRIIPGLERELLGLKAGDKKTIIVRPAEGYGEINPDAVHKIPKGRFPEGVKIEVGASFKIKDPQGRTLTFTITAIEGDIITIDFNHPLAGKILAFEVLIIDVKDSAE